MNVHVVCGGHYVYETNSLMYSLLWWEQFGEDAEGFSSYSGVRDGNGHHTDATIFIAYMLWIYPFDVPP